MNSHQPMSCSRGLGVLGIFGMTLLSAACNEVFHATGDAATDGPPTGCKAMPSLCTGTTPACDMVADKCVECTVASHDLCTGAEPVCGTEQACRGCTAHSECASEVCLPDGSCAAEGDVAYVSGAGSGTACTKAAPCKTITQALAVAPAKATVKVKGAIDDHVTFSNRDATILAEPGAKLTSASAGTLITVGGTSKVTVFDLAIKDAAGPGIGFGVVVQPASTGSFSLTRGEVSGCREQGISAGSGALVVRRSLITGNTGGGIQVTGNGGFSLVNNFIVSNGSGSSAVGGLQISNVTQAVAAECAFNTIYNNDVIPSAIAGVSCQTVGVPLAFKNNIVFANKVAAGGTQVGGSAMCQHTYSDIGPDTVAGTGNINADPQFANVAQTNVYLKSTSPAKDVADPAATLMIDFDGDVRPQGGGRDLGADEYKP